MKNITRSALITAAAGFTMLVFAPHTQALDPGALRTKIRETVRQEIKKENSLAANESDIFLVSITYMLRIILSSSCFMLVFERLITGVPGG